MGQRRKLKLLWLTLRWLVSPKTALRFLLRGGPGLYRIRTALYATAPVFFLSSPRGQPAGYPRVCWPSCPHPTQKITFIGLFHISSAAHGESQPGGADLQNKCTYHTSRHPKLTFDTAIDRPGRAQAIQTTNRARHYLHVVFLIFIKISHGTWR